MAEPGYDLADIAATPSDSPTSSSSTFHLLGVSMGGAIAQEIALQAPGRVRTLTLAVTFSTGGDYSRRLAEVWGARVRQISHEQHIDELMLMNHSEEFYENPDMIQFIRTAMLQNPHPPPAEGLCRQLAGLQLPRRTQPSGLAHDAYARDRRERDILVPIWKSQEIAAAIPTRSWTCSRSSARPLAGACRGVQRGRARVHPRERRRTGVGHPGAGRAQRPADVRCIGTPRALTPRARRRGELSTEHPSVPRMSRAPRPTPRR